jgi:hypothetical protein
LVRASQRRRRALLYYTTTYALSRTLHIYPTKTPFPNLELLFQTRPTNLHAIGPTGPLCVPAWSTGPTRYHILTARHYAVTTRPPHRALGIYTAVLPSNALSCTTFAYASVRSMSIIGHSTGRASSRCPIDLPCCPPGYYCPHARIAMALRGEARRHEGLEERTRATEAREARSCTVRTAAGQAPAPAGNDR